MQEDRWERLRQIIREENEALEKRLVQLISQGKPIKIGFQHGRWTGVTPEQMEAWKAAYGMVDIEAELKRAAAWIVSNPHLAPRSQLGRFLNTWFAKGQDRASIRSIPARDEQPQPKRACSYCSSDATGSVAGILCCSKHVSDAMDGKPRRMLGVVAAPVAGRD